MSERILSKKVDGFIKKQKTWQEEYARLREYVLETELEEDFKWMHPCYTLDGRNVLLIHAFKEYIAILFHKGVLLKDKENILIQQTPNVQVARQIRFTSLEQIEEMHDVIKQYILEAIVVEKSGVEPEMKSHDEYELPEEFKEKLAENPALKEAFEALTPGRQRMYILHFSSAKQAKTRVSRIEKCIPMIMEGKGLKD